MTTHELKLQRPLTDGQDLYAMETRHWLDAQRVLMLNLIGSPGCGKTALLEATLRQLKGRCRIGVIEGDPETGLDAERIRAAGAPAIQLVTHGGCHLAAHPVNHAVRGFGTPAPEMIFVENVGNLVCPADFDLGERGKVAVLSTAEGEDKPLKYPLLFREAMAIVLTKMDLLPLLDFSIESCMSNIRMLNPTAPVFTLSSASGAGLDAWIAWLLQQRCVASDPRRIP